jgi:hypothetical protein
MKLASFEVGGMLVLYLRDSVRSGTVNLSTFKLNICWKHCYFFFTNIFVMVQNTLDILHLTTFNSLPYEIVKNIFCNVDN